MSPRPAAENEVARILAMVPWILANPGRPRSEIAERFGVSEERVAADLTRILLIGTPPFGGGDYIDVLDDDEDGVTIVLADAFRRRLLVGLALRRGWTAPGRTLGLTLLGVVIACLALTGVALFGRPVEIGRAHV